VLDYHDDAWPDEVIQMADGAGVAAAANAVRGGVEVAIRTVADGGRLATITSDPPTEERGIAVSSVYVRADGGRLQELGRLLGDGRLALTIASVHRLTDAADALEHVLAGRTGGAVALVP
jgi:NADPH:quinone reductase-like Zn-dependent oxidoreductase